MSEEPYSTMNLGNLYLITEESFPKDFFKVDWRQVCNASPTKLIDGGEKNEE